MGRMSGRVAAVWLLSALAPLASSSTAAAAPSFAIGGLRDPATAHGALELTVLASESEPGVRLTTATALLDGAFADDAPFGDGTTASLTVLTGGVGTHTLTVIVRNSLGESAAKEETFEVVPFPVSNPTVTVQIGSDPVSPGPGPGPGPQPGERGCAAPRLSMFLAQKPLRYRRGVPVLAAGRRYLFSGRLTCRIDGRRRPAPRGTEVQVLHRTRRRLMSKDSLAVGRDGRIAVRLAFPSRRVVIFRARGDDGRFVSVRIAIRVADLERRRR